MKRCAVCAVLLMVMSICHAEDDSVTPDKPKPPEPQYESEGISIPPAHSDEPIAELSIDRAGA